MDENARIYEEPRRFDRAEALELIEQGGADAYSALVGLAFHDEDGELVESICHAIVARSDADDLRRLAVLCLGHVGRIHKRVHLAETRLLLHTLLDDPILGGTADDALSDISIFVDGKQPD